MLKSFSKRKIIAGCDEAGRGCLAGPVVAAAVILPKGFKNKKLKDSKVLSKKNRNLLRKIIEKEAVSWAIGIVSAEEIDKINILNASFLAMHRAIEKLEVEAELLIIDGNRFNPYHNIPHECIIKGDGKFMSIAAASVLAKTYRDQIMIELDFDFPEYYWKNNKGYPTKQHRKAIEEIGISKQHRKTFQLLSTQLNLSL
jgi:ribonuclease HII|tara:strand:- start:3074 stop:3670 length:597 start_codon:yes stop_codon:yes gene_type:complete